VRIEHGRLYLADLSPRSGTEPGKMRPVLVIQSDLLNEAAHLSTWILPCTTRTTGGNILRVEVPRGIAGNQADCEIMLDQSRAIDNRRFKRPLELLPKPLLNEVKMKLRTIAEL
jgi:mRNA interferase MazF